MSEHLARYLETLSRTQHALSSGFRALRRGHPREPDLGGVCERLAAQCGDHAERLEPFLRRYRAGGSRAPLSGEPRAVEAGPRTAGLRPPGLEVPRLEAAGFDGFDAAGFDAGHFDPGHLDPSHLDPGGLETPDLQRVVRGAGERERAGAEGADAGPGRRPRATPGRGGDGGGLALLRDLHGLYLLATECDLSWSVAAQAARGLRDDELLGLTRHCASETAVQLLWLRTRMRQAAPQVLVVS
ncbi:hypothetical protein [Microbispora sp. NBRC 16548]|uniref:hypothetical protein n=1 Tax=Microbispora sp. NBRC 16548 TaxID=3030994 RepID=UPI001609CC48|nr:hypothetical protein [Microbispora sp. NBRC 16548]GLX03895.1 hypothetical protein Misp03_08220 [Microbispora sp. NBRC 16548]